MAIEHVQIQYIANERKYVVRLVNLPDQMVCRDIGVGDRIFLGAHQSPQRVRRFNAVVLRLEIHRVAFPEREHARVQRKGLIRHRGDHFIADEPRKDRNAFLAEQGLASGHQRLIGRVGSIGNGITLEVDDIAQSGSRG